MSKACKALLVRKSNRTGSAIPLQSNSSVLRGSRPRSNVNEGGKTSNGHILCSWEPWGEIRAVTVVENISRGETFTRSSHPWRQVTQPRARCPCMVKRGGQDPSEASRGIGIV